MYTVKVTRHAIGTPLKAEVVTKADLDAAYRAPGAFPADYENRNDWKTFQEAETIAKLLNQSHADLHRTFQATDAGPYCSPRYDVIDLPQIGSVVSYTFNGDYYPAGRITKMSAGPTYRRIEATDANGRKSVFHRRHRDGKPTGGAWIMNGTWSMIEGNHNKLSPEF